MIILYPETQQIILIYKRSLGHNWIQVQSDNHSKQPAQKTVPLNFI
jgi:hypothetical protein